MSRFGFSLGFGDKTVKGVYKMNSVDCHTLLVVVNFTVEGLSHIDGNADDIPILVLVDCLRQVYVYFLDYCLPTTRRKLIEAIDCPQNGASFLILKFFNGCMWEVRKHVEYEEKTVFKYMNTLTHSGASKDYQISTFLKHHEQVGEWLMELENITIKYCPAKTNTSVPNTTLFDIYACEEELESHYKVKDYLFVPTTPKLEGRMRENEK